MAEAPPRTGWPKSLADYLGWEPLGSADNGCSARFTVRAEHVAPNGFLQAATVVALADWDAVVTNDASGKKMALFRCTQLLLYPK